MSATAVQQVPNLIRVGDREIEVNQEGYLVNFDDWDAEVAKTMAAIDHLELSSCHWEAIKFLREYYTEYEIPPSPRVVIKAIGDKINTWGCTSKNLEQAFPLGGCKHACRLAGLPSYYCHAC